MTLSEAFSRFETARVNGEIPYVQRTGNRTISENYRDVVFSHVRSALQHLLGEDAGDLSTVEIEPFTSLLPDAAHEAAARAGRAKPANERASVQLFLRTVLTNRDLGVHRSGTPCKPAADRVHPDWRPLYAALVDHVREEERRAESEGGALKGGPRGYPSQLVRFQELAAWNRVFRPNELPPCYATVRQWARDAGWSDARWYGAINAYRKAVERVGNPGLPTLFQRIRDGDRGLRTLPDLKERLEQRGEMRDPLDIEMTQIIRILAPRWGEALERRLELGRQRNRSAIWLSEQVDGTSRILASLIRLGRDPSELQPYLSLWEQTVMHAQGRGPDELIASVLGEGYDGAREVTLVRRVALETAPRAHANSPLEVATTHEGPDLDQVPFAGTILRDVRNAWGITADVFGEALEERDRERWCRLEAEYGRTLAFLRKHNAGFELKNRREKWHVAGYGELVCEGLPVLRQRALNALAAADDFERREGSLATPRGRSLALAADTVLSDYVLMAVLLDDGLRARNYAYALSGVHFKPEGTLLHSEGTPGFERLATSFRGLDHPGVRLKIRHTAGGRERRRERYLLPGLVDHALLYRYWYETRPRDLVRAGVLADAAGYDPSADRYAVFVRRRPPQRNRTHRATPQMPWQAKAVASGCMSPGALSNRFGKTLHWVMSEVLKTDDLPPWGSPELRHGKWRGVFGLHISRTILAVYHGGIRDNWHLAKDLTDDEEGTLRDHYVKMKPGVSRLLQRSDSRNPKWFDVVIDAILTGHEGEDWGTFWDSFRPGEPVRPDFAASSDS